MMGPANFKYKMSLLKIILVVALVEVEVRYSGFVTLFKDHTNCLSYGV